MRLFSAPRRSVLLAGALAAALALTACSGGAEPEKPASSDGDGGTASWDKVVAAAKEEGTVNLSMGGSQLQMDRLVAAFQEKYPEIEVVPERITSDGIARIEAQITTGVEGADVFILANESWFDKFKKYLLPADGPNADAIPAEEWPVPGRAANVMAVPYSMFVWNKDKFPKGFKDWDDVLDSSVKGQVGTMGTASATAAGYLDFLSANLGDDVFSELGTLKPKLYPSIVPMTLAVGSGEIGLTIASSPADVKALEDAGAPVDYAIPKPAYGIDYSAAALTNARNKNAAEVFMDFTISPEGQEALNGDGLGISYRTDKVKGSIENKDFTMLDSAKFTPEETLRWKRVIEENFGG